MDVQLTKKVLFDHPAAYQIKVLGKIDPNWFDQLDSMTICVTKEEGRPSITTLSGEVSDQAALLGILNWLYELHLPLLLVICQSYTSGGE
jgi:hypothetical protein